MRRGTQQEQIQGAKRAYIMPLNNPKIGTAIERFSVYLDNGNGLEILWPSDSHLRDKSTETLPHQTFSKRDKYPAFHFALGGGGYRKTYEIREELRRINPSIEVSILSGWSPGNA